jgi:hypothetical protein
MKELTLQEAALAWAQGKRVEAMDPSAKPELWMAVSEIGKDSRTSYTAAVFNEDAGIYRFRLAPEPPAKRYRPYNRAELCNHLGKVVEAKGGDFTALIIIVLHEAVHIGNSHYTFKNLLEDFTWKDGSPCGVEVEA